MIDSFLSFFERRSGEVSRRSCVAFHGRFSWLFVYYYVVFVYLAAADDNTGYITEGQLFLRRDSDIGKVIVDPFRSLSRLKQLVTGKKTRKDHPQVMNAAVRLYADAANAKTKMENGFDLTNYDERTLAFAKDYSNQLLAIDVNLDTTEMLDVAWGLFGKYFRPEEVNIKKDLVDQYWPKQNN